MANPIKYNGYEGKGRKALMVLKHEARSRSPIGPVGPASRRASSCRPKPTAAGASGAAS